MEDFAGGRGVGLELPGEAVRSSAISNPSSFPAISESELLVVFCSTDFDGKALRVIVPVLLPPRLLSRLPL